MNKRERFLNVLANKPVDRVPVAFFHHFLPWDEFGKGVENDDIFQRNIEGHRKARAIFDPDVIKIMNDSLLIMPLDTSFVKKASDLRKVEPIAMNSKFVQRSLELTKRSRAIYADSEAPIFATGFSPSFILRNSLTSGFPDGGEAEAKLKGFVAEDPDSLAAACQILGEGIKEFNRLLIQEGGVDGIYFSVNNQAGFFADDIYLKYVAPQEKAVLDAANKLSDLNLLHICGFQGRSNNLRLFTDFHAAAYNWAVHAEKVSLTEGKKLFGGKAVFGGFEQATVIYKGTREEVEAFTWKILDECGQVGVMIGADCTVPTDIDDNRLEWARQATIKYANK
jgi:uroporphyrinogen decarboxylase